MEKKYATNRVEEPKHVLTTSAWRLDNNRTIEKHEMRVEVKAIHIEGTSFHQICLETNDNDESIKEKIMDIVIRRGKLHNPVTDTGGLAYGVVSEIGEEYENSRGLQTGEEVICNASLTSMPLYIRKIKSIDRAYHQIEVEGYLIVFGEIPVIRRPKELPINLLLYIFNESGTMFRASEECQGKSQFMVGGNNIMMNLMYGYVIRRSLGNSARIVCVLDKKSNVLIKGEGIDRLIDYVFDTVYYVDLLHPLEALNTIGGEEIFDLSINCAEIPGAETLNILATKKQGVVIFANLINNYNISLYITESISRHLDIKCADGYLPTYDEFDIQLVKELAPYFEEAEITAVQMTKGTQRELGKLNLYRSMAEDFVCESRSMALVLKEISSVAKYDCNVLITGETGVGKEKVANMIVKNSNRSMQRLIKVNCAAISPNLMEAEFFGYEPGAFTGAKDTGKKGFFEVADNGFVFLDEVGELPLDIQAKLLRVIQDGEFFRVGGTKPIKCNVRILSATNRNLEEAVENKTFRRDLYYRLNVFPIRVPSLQERPEDVAPLVEYFIKKYCEEFGVEKGITEEALSHLERNLWLGNIRELENVVQRLIIGAPGEEITLIDVTRQLHGDIFENGELPVNIEKEEMDLEQMVSGVEKQIIKYASEKYGSTRKAAKAIGISQTQFVRKKKKYEI